MNMASIPRNLSREFTSPKEKQSGISYDKLVGNLYKTIAIAGVAFFLLSIFLTHRSTCQTSQFFTPFQRLWVSSPNSTEENLPTNISHIVFGLVGSVDGWRRRRPFIETWWKTNVTRGYLFLDVPPSSDLLPWRDTSPPFRVSENNTALLEVTKHDPTMVRIARGLLETFREGDEDVRWIVMGDDDSIFFLENMLDVLGKYDHNKYVYIGGHSESILPNFIHSFDMGFGGAGVIFSYPLAAALAPRLDECIMRYPWLYAADQMWQSCLADLGVYMNNEKGIHQFDLHGDVSGFLSAHPQAPLISLHHAEKVEPYFPNTDRYQSVMHIMRAAKFDQSRMLQQTICYERETNWSVSVSWGYSAHIYEIVLPKSVLQRPIETFRPWVEDATPPRFIFNTRYPISDPCQTPHIFYFQSIKPVSKNLTVTTYARAAPRGLPTCEVSGNHSADGILKIQVYTSSAKLEAMTRECCDVVRLDGKNRAKVKYRECVKDEVIG